MFVQVGGYKLPFVVMGVLLMLFAIPLAVVVPSAQGLLYRS
jgi:hypothetical protein